jgi:hypothetical protein
MAARQQRACFLTSRRAALFWGNALNPLDKRTTAHTTPAATCSMA